MSVRTIPIPVTVRHSADYLDGGRRYWSEEVEVEVPCHPIGRTGLALTRPVSPTGRVLPGWRITHLASRKAIGPEFEALKIARRAATAIAPMADWTQSADALLSRGDSLAAKVMEAIRLVREG